jgi:hypothetical protein
MPPQEEMWPTMSSSSTDRFIILASDQNLWYGVIAFVALVKPLDLFKGAASSYNS